MIVALVGRKQSGKGSTAKVLVEQHGFVEVAFADALKDFVSQMFGWPRAALDDQAFKTSGRGVREVGDLNWRDKVDPASAARFVYEHTETLTPRWVLQAAGQAARKTFGDDFWIERTKAKIDALQAALNPSEHLRDLDRVLDEIAPRIKPRKGDRIVISDVRYFSELHAVRSWGAKVVRLNRGDAPHRHDFYGDAVPHEAGGKLCDYTYPDGDWCGLPAASHPTTWTNDRHTSETELPIESPLYDLTVTASSGDEAAAGALNGLRAKGWL